MSAWLLHRLANLTQADCTQPTGQCPVVVRITGKDTVNGVQLRCGTGRRRVKNAGRKNG